MPVQLLEWIGAWPGAVLLRGSGTAWLLVDAAHILGVGLLVGAIVPLDLRLLGLFRALPLALIAPFLSRAAAAGAALAFATGLWLFSMKPAEYLANGAFLWKAALLALALANVALQHANRGYAQARRRARCGRQCASPPWLILLWLGAGRRRWIDSFDPAPEPLETPGGGAEPGLFNGLAGPQRCARYGYRTFADRSGAIAMSDNHASATRSGGAPQLAPKVLSFDVFGTLTSNWDGSIEAFRSILRECGGAHIDTTPIPGILGREKYHPLLGAISALPGNSRIIFGRSIRPLWDARSHEADRTLLRYFSRFELYPDVPRTLEILSRHAYRVSTSTMTC